MPEEEQHKGNVSKKTSKELRNLKSLIYHAKEVQDGMEALHMTLNDWHRDGQDYTISPSLQINLTHIQEIFGNSYDLVIRKCTAATLNREAALLFINHMVDQATISEHIIKNLTSSPITTSISEATAPIEYLKNTLLTTVSVSEQPDLSSGIKSILNGDSLLLIDGIPSVLVLNTRKLETRAITKAETEIEVQGPFDSFTEDMETNITLVRRRIKDPNCIVQKVTIGLRTDTDVALIYYRGIVNQELVYEMEKRLTSLKRDVGNTTNITSLLADSPYSPFPTIFQTERPDKFSMSILMGKVGVIVDGNPFGMIAPTCFSDHFRASEDYIQKAIPASTIRFLRYIAAFFSLTLPALYIAITAFHPALIPTPLTLTLGLAREGVPFPVFLETLLMIFFLEIFQEGGIRIPTALGPAISITGGLIIGDSAVRAGLISPALVIITAFTALATFCNTNYQMALAFRVLRILLMIAAAIFGAFGVVMGLLLIAAHLSQLESLGMPYLGMSVPDNLKSVSNLKDTIVVAPPASQQERPHYLEPQDDTKQSTRIDNIKQE